MSAIFGSLMSAFRAARRSLDVLNPSSAASADSTAAPTWFDRGRDQHDSYGDDSYDEDEDEDEDDDESLPPISNIGRSRSRSRTRSPSLSPTRQHRRFTSTGLAIRHEQQQEIEAPGRDGFASASSSSPISASRGKPRFLPYSYPKQSVSSTPPPTSSPARSSSTTPKSSRPSAAASAGLHISTSASPPPSSPPSASPADSAAHTYYLLCLSPTLLSLARLWFQGSTTVLIPLEPTLQAILGESETDLIAKLAHRAKKYASYEVAEGNEIKRVKAAAGWLYQGDWVEVKVEGSSSKGKGKPVVVECVDVGKFRKASMAWIAHDHLTDLLVEVGKVDIRRIPEGLLIKEGMSLFIPHAKIRIDAHHPLLMSPRKSPTSPNGGFRLPKRASRPTSPSWLPSPSSALQSPTRPAYRRASVAPPPPPAPPRSPVASASSAGGIKRGYAARRTMQQDSDSGDAARDQVNLLDTSDDEPPVKRLRCRTLSLELPNQSRIASPIKPLVIDSESSSSSSSSSESESESDDERIPSPAPAPPPPAPKPSLPRARRSKTAVASPPPAAALPNVFRRPTTAPVVPRPALAASSSSSASSLQQIRAVGSPVRPRTAPPPVNRQSPSHSSAANGLRPRSSSGLDIVIEVPEVTPRPTAPRARTRSQLAHQIDGGGGGGDGAGRVDVQDVRQTAMALVREIEQGEREIRELAGRVGVDAAVGLRAVLEMDMDVDQ